MSHCCFSLQFPSKYRLLFERFPGLSAFALWELYVYIFRPFSPSCVCLVNSQVTDSNPLTVIRVIRSPPQPPSLQVLNLALNVLLHSKIMQGSSYISLHIWTACSHLSFWRFWNLFLIIMEERGPSPPHLLPKEMVVPIPSNRWTTQYMRYSFLNRIELFLSWCVNFSCFRIQSPGCSILFHWTIYVILYRHHTDLTAKTFLLT